MRINKKDLKSLGSIIAKQRLIKSANNVKIQAGYKPLPLTVKGLLIQKQA